MFHIYDKVNNTPRIRDISDSKLFTIGRASEYSKLEAIIVQGHENGYFLDKKVGTYIPIIVLG